MDLKYRFLEPLQVGNMRLKNRVILTPMARHLATRDGFVTDAFCAHYERIARGGAALILPGIAAIDSSWPYVSNNQLWLDDDKYIPGLEHFVNVIHEARAKVGFQLWCSGMANTGRSINDFSLDEIHRLQNLYLEAARRCKAAGADCIEFHIAHTYLPCEFLSPAWNQRTDRYGADTVENAIRFSVECIRMIRDELCRDGLFEVIAKINGADFYPGGITPDYCAEACVHLEKAGVSLITVNAGGALADLTDMSDNGRRPEGWKVYLAEAVKEKISIPVAACGSIRHPEFADSILREGRCDVIAMARGLYAEPDWVMKAAEGREDEMRCCISCMFCFTTVGENTAGCSVNPFAKRELYYSELKKNGNGQTVYVIGSGPAGLEAAVSLAERGFSVTVFEKDREIGGLVRLAAVPPGKQKMRWLIDYYNSQIQRLNVKIVTGAVVSPESLEADHPYAIIVTSGSEEWMPGIPGIHSPSVIPVRDLLEDRGKSLSGKKIAVLGGGLTALEAAYYLQERGNQVTVIEMLPYQPNVNLETQLARRDAERSGVQLVYGCTIVSVEEGRVMAKADGDSGERAFEMDLAVASLGFRGGDVYALVKTDDSYEKMICCACPRKISEAVQAGSDIARLVP